MSRKLCLVLLALFFAVPTPAPVLSGPIMRTLDAGATCNTLSLDFSGGFDATINSTFYSWFGSKFVVGGSGVTLCRVDVQMAQAGAASAGTLQVAIYTDNGGAPAKPGTLVGTASATIDRTTAPSGLTYMQFTGLNAVLSASTTYWMVVKSSVVDANTSNQIAYIVHTAASSSIDGSVDGGSTWDANISVRSFNWKGYVSP